MLRDRIAVTVLGLLTVTGACNTQERSAAVGEGAGNAAAEALAVFEGTPAPWNAGDAASVLATVADEVVQLQPDTVLRGKEALTARWSDYLAQHTATWVPTVIDAYALGDLAFIRARFTETAVPKDGGPTTTESGLALEVYRRQADGTWKLVMESWYTDPLTVPSVVTGHGPALPVEDSVRAAFHDYVAVSGPTNIESAIAMLHDSVVHMPPAPGATSLGKEALAAAWRGLMQENPDYLWSPQLLDVVVSGDLGFVRYTGSETYTAKSTGQMTTVLGSGWDVFRRDGAGGWKLIHESRYVAQ